MGETRLSRHRLIATTDVGYAREEVAQQFCPHRLELTRRDGSLDMVHNAAPIGRNVALHYLRYGGEVRITPGRFNDFFLVQIPVTGHARVKVGERVVASDRSRASVGSPTEPVDMIWDQDCEQLLVYLRREAVEQAAGGDGEPVVFDPMLDLRAPAPRAWLRMVHLGLDDLESGGALFASPLAAHHFEQALISSLLTAQPNSGLAAVARPTPSGRTVRSVADLIENEPGHAWTLADLAAEAGVSPRTLQQAFQREFGMSPLKHLRRTRMERARQDLLNANPSSASVTDIAIRWGFFHLGRFSQSYRATYHELPSQTLAS